MLVGLLGRRIGYSASPAMQNAAFRAAGLDGWSYELFDVEPPDLAAAVAALRLPGRAGANVTIPYKRVVAAMLDATDPVAAEAGAVNLIRRDGERLLGANTDVEGVRAALAQVGYAGGPAVILGAGGSARAAQVALAGAPVEVVARDRWERRGELVRAAEVVVNCTPLGREGEAALAPGDLPRRAVVDLVYARGGTPLTAAATAAGLRVADGWTVLLAQGAASFTAWTGLPAPIAAMREALAA